MKKAIIGIVVVLLLAVVLAASMREGGGGGKGVEVYAEEVEQRDITQVVEASGQVDPRVKVDISAHVVARIEKIHAEEGDEIEAGEPFVELERDEFLAARDRARAQLEISRSLLAQAEIEVADAELKVERSKKGEAERILSAEHRENAELRLRTALLRLEQHREEIRRSRADLEKALADLQKTTIYAPISGRVISLAAEEGEVVVSGTMNNAASVIATVADLSEILVEVLVDETEIVEVAEEQRARVKIDALPDEELPGRVVEIGSSGIQRGQQRDVIFFRVKILLDEPDARLRSGMSARAEIEVASREAVPVLPIQAVVYREPLAEEEAPEADDEVQVVFLMEGAEAEQRRVEVGLSDDTHIEITRGLEGGELVVTGPYRAMRELADGDPLRRKRSPGSASAGAASEDETEARSEG